jgi:hypothetical protein
MQSHWVKRQSHHSSKGQIWSTPVPPHTPQAAGWNNHARHGKPFSPLKKGKHLPKHRKAATQENDKANHPELDIAKTECDDTGPEPRIRDREMIQK